MLNAKTFRNNSLHSHQNYNPFDLSLVIDLILSNQTTV